MKKKVFVVLKSQEWLSIFRSIINQELPRLYDDVIFLDSFDEAIDKIPLDGKLVVISSEVFDDEASPYRELHGPIIPDDEKDGATFAKLVKKLNPNSKVYIFSEYEPKTSENIDGCILIQQHGNVYTKDVLKVLKFVS